MTTIGTTYPKVLRVASIRDKNNMAINPEAQIFRDLERAEGKPEEILTPAERYVERVVVKQMDDLRPRFKDFKYTKQVKEHQEELRHKILEEERISGRSLSDRSRRGKIAEALIFNCIEMNNWFGENCATVAASEYDDLCQGTDVVLEFDRGDKIVRLAVDVTIKQDPSDKKHEVLEGIENGELTRLQYFVSELDETQGQVSRIPKIILQLDVPTIQRLCRLISNHKKAELARDQVQYDFLREAQEQLEDQIDHAQDYFREKPYRESNIVINRIQEALDVICEIQKNKKELA